MNVGTRSFWKILLPSFFVLLIITTSFVLFFASSSTPILTQDVLLLNGHPIEPISVGDSPDCVQYAHESIVLLVISCGRWNELTQTLDSFEYYNTYKCLKRKVVMDDCNDIEGLHAMATKYASYGYEFVRTTTPRNATYAPGQVRTMFAIHEGLTKYCLHSKYVFHIEDDWKFYQFGFIEDSWAVMKTDEMRKENQRHLHVSMVNLRNTQSGYHKLQYHVHKSDPRCWRSWSANPGLKLNVFLVHQIEECIRDFYVNNVSTMEYCVACVYQKKWFRIAGVTMWNGYVGHLGTHSRVETQQFSKISHRVLMEDNHVNVRKINDKYAMNTTTCMYIEL
eukprot:241686_1